MRAYSVLFLVALLPLASAATSIHIEWDVEQPVDDARRYVEHFPSSSVECTDCVETTDDDIVVQWWRYSDQTGSSWPDDDANLRAGLMGVELNQSRSIINAWCGTRITLMLDKAERRLLSIRLGLGEEE